VNYYNPISKNSQIVLTTITKLQDLKILFTFEKTKKIRTKKMHNIDYIMF
jgi:hypothetical protein